MQRLKWLCQTKRALKICFLKLHLQFDHVLTNLKGPLKWLKGINTPMVMVPSCCTERLGSGQVFVNLWALLKVDFCWFCRRQTCWLNGILYLKPAGFGNLMKIRVWWYDEQWGHKLVGSSGAMQTQFSKHVHECNSVAFCLLSTKTIQDPTLRHSGFVWKIQILTYCLNFIQPYSSKQKREVVSTFFELRCCNHFFNKSIEQLMDENKKSVSAP